MSESEQLIRQVNSGNMAMEQLEQLLESVNYQVERYKEGAKLIEDAGTDNWTYEVYTESLRVGGAGAAKPIARQQWEQMFNKHKQLLRTIAINYINDGQQNFERIKTEVMTELERQRKATK